MSQQSSPIIAPFKTGLETDVQPWLAPPDSFQTLSNFHVEHGYLERRNGYQYFAPDGQSQLTNNTAVTGFGTFIERDGGSRTLLAFDTQSAYTYSGVSESFTQLTADASSGGSVDIMNGGNHDYVWSANWLSSEITVFNRLYFTNGKPSSGGKDGIWFYPSATGGATQVTRFSPLVSDGTVTLIGAKLIFSLGQRLILLHTYEGTSSDIYPQRARWCAKQNPDPSLTGGWIDTIAGKGSYVDAATSDQIISAQLVQNQIIVFFTNSVWSLVPTSDPNQAFRWQKINNFRACGGKMASVGFDRHANALGDRGITATDGANTSRIDERISDFTISNMSQTFFANTFCLRDYNTRRWWTLYTSATAEDNDKVLVYDDESRAFSTYDLSMNVLGYGIEGSDYAFEDFTAANNKDFAFEDFNEDEDFSYYSFQQNSYLFIGGDLNGYVYQMESTSKDITTDIESNFLSAAWNPFKEEGKDCVFPYIDFFLDTSPSAVAQIDFYKNTESVPYVSRFLNFLPDLRFIVPIVDISQGNPCNVNAINHGLSTGDLVYIYLVEGMTEVNSTQYANGFTVTVIDANNITLDGVDSTAFTEYSTGGGLFRDRFYQTKVWKRVYGGGTGFQHRIGWSSMGEGTAYRIHGFKPTFKARGKRLISP